tara:strand:- start:12649 stop:13746 length:1098 start_codon:yes stop_codon:yes gene_type:complete
MKQIGYGTYSTVYSRDGVAVKSMSLDLIDSAAREVVFSLITEHPSIIKINAVKLSDTIELIMMEYPTDLYKYKIRGDVDVVGFGFDICSAVAYLHANGIIHCDLKPQNILVKDRTAVICDFGISVKENIQLRLDGSSVNEKHPVVQSIQYRAPEISLINPRYTSAIDIWSIGCILAELLTGQPLIKVIGDSSKQNANVTFNVKESLLSIHSLCYIYREFIVDKKPVDKKKWGWYLRGISYCISDVKYRTTASMLVSILTAGIKQGYPELAYKLTNTCQHPYSKAKKKQIDDVQVIQNVPIDIVMGISPEVIKCAEWLFDRKPVYNSRYKTCLLYLAFNICDQYKPVKFDLTTAEIIAVLCLLCKQ